jgi:hypothetical protein
MPLLEDALEKKRLGGRKEVSHFRLKAGILLSVPGWDV